MSKVHVFIDGTWFLKVIDGNVFDRFVVYPNSYEIDFSKLNSLLLKHVSEHTHEATELGNCYFVTSLFDLPDDFDSWVGKQITNPYGGQSITVSSMNIEKTHKNVDNRVAFANAAIDAGYNPNCIFHVTLQEWMFLNLLHPELRYQEKQVDTTVVALLVKDAIENPNDCFALVSGDADILPAIQVTYPNYTRNVFPVITSRNELDCRNRQTSFMYSQYTFDIPILILQNHVSDIMKGNVYRCVECQKFFATRTPIDQSRIDSGAIMPRCPICRR